MCIIWKAYIYTSVYCISTYYNVVSIVQKICVTHYFYYFLLAFLPRIRVIMICLFAQCADWIAFHVFLRINLDRILCVFSLDSIHFNKRKNNIIVWVVRVTLDLDFVYSWIAIFFFIIFVLCSLKILLIDRKESIAQ